MEMAMNSGPYYTNSLANHELHADTCIYPDLGQSLTTNPQMYSLADGAVQAHQRTSSTDLAGLIRAATVAAGRETDEIADGPEISAKPRRTMKPFQATVDAELVHASDPHQLRKRNQPQVRRGKSIEEHVTRSQISQKQRGTSDTRSPEPGHGIDDTTSNDDGQLESICCNQIREQQNLVSDVRVAGVHSAAALFRKPPASSKKYTRPPMSKLFTSLELSPENFLHLQAAAKGYMLNGSYPERRECVGQRGKGDSELVKLRLWNCVKEFLDREGNGARFFGTDVPGDEGMVRTMIWPVDKNRIIRVVTPLLRRMVTNERQRQYAVEARKTGATGDEAHNKKRKLIDTVSSPGHAAYHSSPLELRARSMEIGLHEMFMEINGDSVDAYNLRDRYHYCNLAFRLDNLAVIAGLPGTAFNGVVATIDYHLQKSHSKGHVSCGKSCEGEVIQRMLAMGLLDHGRWQTISQGNDEDKHAFTRSVLREIFSTIKEAAESSESGNHWEELASPDITHAFPRTNISAEPMQRTIARLQPESAAQFLIQTGSLVLRFNILQAGRRVVPRIDVSAHKYSELQTVLDAINQSWSPMSLGHTKLSVLLPEGLVPIHDREEWRSAMGAANCIDWMDGELKVIIEV